MALSLPDDFPTDHITWESRGFFGDEPEGFRPVTAPGALLRARWVHSYLRVDPLKTSCLSVGVARVEPQLVLSASEHLFL